LRLVQDQQAAEPLTQVLTDRDASPFAPWTGLATAKSSTAREGFTTMIELPRGTTLGLL
jgi:hypothetical protein